MTNGWHQGKMNMQIPGWWSVWHLGDRDISMNHSWCVFLDKKTKKKGIKSRGDLWRHPTTSQRGLHLCSRLGQSSTFAVRSRVPRVVGDRPPPPAQITSLVTGNTTCLGLPCWVLSGSGGSVVTGWLVWKCAGRACVWMVACVLVAHTLGGLLPVYNEHS